MAHEQLTDGIKTEWKAAAYRQGNEWLFTEKEPPNQHNMLK